MLVLTGFLTVQKSEALLVAREMATLKPAEGKKRQSDAPDMA